VIANRPSAVHDICLPTNGTNESELAGDVGLGTDACPVKYQQSPRQVAGGPITEDIYKCQLKAIDFAAPEYAALSDAQRNRLAAVFPNGVCDWSKPGVGQQDPVGPLTYTAGPGGVPLPAAPTSTAI